MPKIQLELKQVFSLGEAHMLIPSHGPALGPRLGLFSLEA